VRERRLFCVPFYTKTRIYQDRLGTNIENG
jgi:hypothetical protein